ncbi:hypothetical protein GCM10023165_08490 [Variovorax defluvii]|uniref:RHS repeat-associated core domain-containing protein n=1 Tax=Variovorax defluvii TaxID=913761 RepID=A0ABP8H377_9BURK
MTAHNRFADLAVTPNPGVTSFAELVFNLRGAGQYFDVESGLRYNYFRSLIDIGRYTQPDPLGLGGGLHRIEHVRGNPLRYSDPSGLLNYEAQRQLDHWFGPMTDTSRCATPECAAGLLPTLKANPTACEMQCGMGSDDANGRALACAAISQFGKLMGVPGIPVTLACKAIDKHACVKSCEEKRQCN